MQELERRFLVEMIASPFDLYEVADKMTYIEQAYLTDNIRVRQSIVTKDRQGAE